MALAKEIMGGGLSAATAQAIGGGVQTGLTATGSSIADALQLTASNVQISTAAASTGVLLPNGVIGDEVLIYNAGANTVAVYPPTSSQSINSGSAGAAFSVATTKTARFKKITSTLWIAQLGA